MEEKPPALTWVPIGPRQAKEILTLVRAIEEYDATPYRSAYDEVLDYFDPAFLWRATAARDYSGRLIAFGLTRMPMNHTGQVEVVLSGGVHPDYRGFGVGRQLLRMQLATAEQLVQGEATSAVALMHVDGGHEDLTDLLSRSGFSPQSGYVQMRRPLADIPSGWETPSFISIEPFIPDLSEEVRKAHNAIYYERFARTPLTEAQWRVERQYTQNSWSFVAVDRRGDRPRVAAYLLSGKYEQDWEALGWSEGYIDEVAVHNEFRGMNLMTALLATAMTAYQSDGIEFAGLDAAIDIAQSEPESAVEIFEHFGFERTGNTSIFGRALEIRPTGMRAT